MMANCVDPSGISDIVECRNAAGPNGFLGSSAVSFVAENLAPMASVACTVSQGSGQPAHPDEGDLRCFQVFESGVIASFNLLEGLNGDRIEVSQPLARGDRERVILANIPTNGPATLAGAIGGAFSPIEPGSRMTCGTCHRTVDHPAVEIDGISTWVRAGIRLNSTVRGTVAKNGQIAPGRLTEVLNGLFIQHGCGTSPDRETCRRITAVSSSPRRFPLDNPPASALNPRKFW